MIMGPSRIEVEKVQSASNLILWLPQTELPFLKEWPNESQGSQAVNIVLVDKVVKKAKSVQLQKLLGKSILLTPFKLGLEQVMG